MRMTGPASDAKSQGESISQAQNRTPEQEQDWKMDQAEPQAMDQDLDL